VSGLGGVVRRAGVLRAAAGRLTAAACLLSLALALGGCAGSRPGPSPGPAGADAATLVALGDSAFASLDQGRARADDAPARAAAAREGDRPVEARALVGLGRYLAAARRYHDARVAFERAASLDSTTAAPYFYLARAAVALNDEKLAIQSLGQGLRRDPGDAPSQALLQSLARSRCAAAGLPPEYGELLTRSVVTRGELGVMIAVELGLDPDRLGWASDRPQVIVPPEVEGAWGAPWLRASVLLGYLKPFPDRSLHLSDPVTRRGLALIVAGLERSVGTRGTPTLAPSDSSSDSLGPEPPPALPDLGPRSYLRRAAARAVRLGLPTHSGGAFDPDASASGTDILRVLDRLSRLAGRTPALPEELRQALVVE
jgi:tetratricopeptide (TPR) repeat protein